MLVIKTIFIYSEKNPTNVIHHLGDTLDLGWNPTKKIVLFKVELYSLKQTKNEANIKIDYFHHFNFLTLRVPIIMEYSQDYS